MVPEVAGAGSVVDVIAFSLLSMDRNALSVETQCTGGMLLQSERGGLLGNRMFRRGEKMTATLVGRRRRA
ncbi:hypothetical protein DLREEDagrD3_20830 [Denitratisoma sp. agr-D3]